jgi:serine/threonine protein kinase
MQQLQRLSNRGLITLGAEIARGGEGAVYEILEEPSVVAKIYHGNSITVEQVHKLKAMVANPPDDPMRKQGLASIAWCLDLLVPSNSGQPIGFLMPKVSGMSSIIDFYDPGSRRQQAPLFNYFYLNRAARNLAVAMRSIHASGYVIGDVNESNILLAETAVVTLVDVDSFQVKDDGKTYRCLVGKPDFTPPELRGKSYRDVDRSPEHDLFGLAVIIFKLLMEGTHPFDGVFTGQGEVPLIGPRIQSGHFPHGTKKVPYRPKPGAPPFNILHPKLQQLFQRCFEEGHTNPSARPTAGDWYSVLDEAEKDLSECSKNKQHQYGKHLNICPWCERTKFLRGRDPFPSVQAVSQGKNLQKSQPVQTPLPLLPKLGIPSVVPPTIKLPPFVSHFLTGMFKAVVKKVAPIKFPLIAGISLVAVTQGYGYSQYRLFPSNPLELIDSKLALVKTLEYEKLTPPDSSLNRYDQAEIVSFSPDGQKILVRGSGVGYVWDLKSNEVNTFSTSGDEIFFSQDSQAVRLFSLRKLTMRLVELKNGKEKENFNFSELNLGNFSKIVPSPDGQIFLGQVSQEVVIGESKRSYGIFNWQGKEISRFSTGINFSYPKPSFSSDGKEIITYNEPNAKFFNLEQKQETDSVNVGGIYGQPSAPIFLGDGKKIAIRNGASIDFWDRQTKRKITSLVSKGYNDAFSQDGKYLAVSDGLNIAIWDWQAGKIFRTLYDSYFNKSKGKERLYDARITSLAFSPDGSTLASATGNGPVRIWKIR